ncbi:STAS domain-containing protein [Listeria costaricensis]|uniref:STAS domain-containing protein n=1 Tax=Listeria costaricensis TaxID=2026604 RepID=UPI000C07EC65|nr:STAS domain-containing protein [Listeria costaricensis]
MSNKRPELYDYLIEKGPVIAKKWSEFMSDAYTEPRNDPAYQEQLYQEYLQTNQLFASYLLSEKEFFKQNFDKWSKKIVEQRISNNMPITIIYIVASKIRITYMEMMKEYKKTYPDFTVEEALNATIAIDEAFGVLTSHYTQRYQEVMTYRLDAQMNLITELGTPIIPITKHVAILPLVGGIDTFRARKIKEIVPQKCVDTEIEILYIDLSDSPALDSVVAEELFELMKILELLGIQSMFSGIRPEVAQSAIQVGLDFNHIKSYSSLSVALRENRVIR